MMKKVLIVFLCLTSLLACDKSKNKNEEQVPTYDITIQSQLNIEQEKFLKSSSLLEDKIAYKQLRVYKTDEQPKLLIAEIKDYKYEEGELILAKNYSLKLEPGEYQLIMSANIEEVDENNQVIKLMDVYTGAQLEDNWLYYHPASNLNSDLFFCEKKIVISDENKVVDMQLARIVGLLQIKNENTIPEDIHKVIVKLKQRDFYYYDNSAVQNEYYEQSYEFYRQDIENKTVIFKKYMLPYKDNRLTLIYQNDKGEVLKTIIVDNIEIKENYITNIVGNLWDMNEDNSTINFSLEDIQWQNSEDIDINNITSDTEGPIIELRDPFENKTYNRGAALPLDVTFSDESGMKSCAVSITYNDPASATQLKGIGTPWAPAENNETDELVIKGTKGGETVTKAKLFDQNIEAASLGGSYTVTFDMEDKVGNKSQKTVNIIIGG